MPKHYSTLKEMTGTWTGYYKHESKLISEEIRNRVTKFRVKIHQFDGKIFKGTIEDNLATGGTEGLGTIQGFIDNNKVSFVKQMPVKTTILPTGKIKITNRKHPPIYYSGRISIDGNIIKGTWKFKRGITWIGFLPALRAPIKGYWEMEKDNDLLQE